MNYEQQILENRKLLLDIVNNSRKLIDSEEELKEISNEDFLLILKKNLNGFDLKKINKNLLNTIDFEVDLYVNTSLAPETIGGYIKGQPITPLEGLTQNQFNDKFFTNINLPTVSFNVSNQIIEKGADFAETINITFDSNDAEATGATFSLEKDEVEVSATQSTAFAANSVIANFTLQGFVSYTANSVLSAGTISTPLRTITQVVPQWRGQRANNNTFDGATYVALNSALTKFVQSEDNTSITVTAGNFGVFISTNNNAAIIEAGTGFQLAPSAYAKNTITAKLANGDDFTLTEYIINPAGGIFSYNLQ